MTQNVARIHYKYQLMLYRKTLAVCCKNDAELKSTLCGQNTVLKF